MRPFLLITTREDHASAAAEYDLYRTLMHLTETELTWHRANDQPVSRLRLHDYSGVLLAGSPYTVSDPTDQKSEQQLRVEHDLLEMFTQIVTNDIPYLGICYGLGTLAHAVNATVDSTYSEPSSSTTMQLTTAGSKDPIFGELPTQFSAYVGHKESVPFTPPEAEVLVTSQRCPIQALRIKQNIYATQYHPELTKTAFEHRVTESAHLGYFPPDQLQSILKREQHTNVEASHLILKKFAEHYGQQPPGFAFLCALAIG